MHVLRVVPLFLAIALAAFAQSPADPAQSGELVNKYCVSCHSEKLKTGGLVLEKPDLANVPANARIWEKVIRKVGTGSMPPLNMPRPDQATLTGFSTYLETSLDRAASAKVNPGRTLIHRLNRTEYANVIKDVLAVN